MNAAIDETTDRLATIKKMAASHPGLFDLILKLRDIRTVTTEGYPLRKLAVFSHDGLLQDSMPANATDLSALDKSGNYEDLLNQACIILLCSPSVRAIVEEKPDLLRLSIYFSEIRSLGLYSGAIQIANRVAMQNHSLGKTIWVMAHELRHGWQHHKGFLDIAPISIQDKILYTRVEEADACAFQTVVAWELKTLGYAQPWKALAQSNKYGPLKHAFTVAARRDDTAIETGHAANAVIEAWFENSLLRNFYDMYVLKKVLKYRKDGNTDHAISLKEGFKNIGQLDYIISDSIKKRTDYLNTALIDRILELDIEASMKPAAARLYQTMARSL